MQISSEKWRKIIREILSTGLLILVILCIRSSVVSHYNVPTGSMIPTILPGDHFIGNQLAFGLRFPFSSWYVTGVETPKRGDIVVFPSPVEEGIDLVKRVVAIGGDTIEVRNGIVVLNGGNPQTELIGSIEEGEAELYWESLGDFRHHVRLSPLAPQARFMEAVRIPEGYFFAMGDNRDNSGDSRFFGPVPIGELRSRAMLLIYSVTGDFPWIDFSRAGTGL